MLLQITFGKVIIGIMIGFLLLLLILGIVWFLLPYYFKYIRILDYDGTYDPKKDTIKKPTPLSIQTTIGKLLLDKKNLSYSIDFGGNRKFTNGTVQIYYKSKLYSSYSSQLETQLTFRGEKHQEGTNDLGIFHKTIWTWQIPQTELTFQTQFLEFPEKDYIIFQFHVEDSISNINIKQMKQPNVKFPCFNNESYNQRILTYRDAQFHPAQRDFDFVTAPVMLFDDAKNVVIISALDHFITNGVGKKLNNKNGMQIQCGTNGHVAIIPQNHTHRYIVVFHQGINESMRYWGSLLRKFHHAPKKERYSDVVCNSLGYFTDNGAYYYYNPIKGKKFDQTLIEVKKHADQMKIPYQYYQLDSWWYIKSLKKWKRDIQGYFGKILGGGLFGGTKDWSPDPYAFDMSLEDLYQKLGQKPFIAHNRWFSDDTIYADKFKFDIIENRALSIDPDFWDYLMAYCKKNHIAVYEQDWLSTHMEKMPRLHSEIGYAEKWLENMAMAAEKHGIAIQYCMATPAIIMQSIHNKAITNSRSAEDYNPRWPHRYDVPPFFQSSMFSSALGLNVIKDTFQTTRISKMAGEKYPELMVLTGALGGGPISPGDAIGHMNAELINATCRKDGWLYKPSHPMIPADITFIKNSTYFIGHTFSQIANYKWIYSLTANFWPKRVKNTDYSLKEIGIDGRYIEYDWFSKKTRLVDTTSKFEDKLEEEQYKFSIYSPLINKSFALLGDENKIIMMNDCEFLSFTAGDKIYSFIISNIQQESMVILFYAIHKPSELLIDEKLIEESEKKTNISWQYSSENKLGKIMLYFAKTREINIQVKM
ncbi:hypothetical protein [Candidatus Lokiarchaeum ossiferum]|uniref:hypothetical protein n=1 Tax=Candidatus Lokiarchaeum ossiferum TaxID=2951803 RepID=UPI00352E913C